MIILSEAELAVLNMLLIGLASIPCAIVGLLAIIYTWRGRRG